MLLAAALIAAVSAPPTPRQYYARALDTMNALPQPAYATYDIRMKATGAGIAQSCSPKAGAAFSIGWGGEMRHELQAHAEYSLSGNAAAIREKDDTYCRDDVALFKPEWAAMHDWMRYGIGENPNSIAQPSQRRAKRPGPALRTIASVTAVAAAAYEIFDSGAATCPSGTPGHALHLVARSDPEKHPLTDVIIDTKSMRFCFMRFGLVNAVVAGTGAKGDMTVSFGDSNGYWAVTQGHAVLSLRMLGVSVKHFALDVSYANAQYPLQLPQAIPPV